ncbi:43937_t:CDS:2, partial [Gigaspora margarita]
MFLTVFQDCYNKLYEVNTIAEHFAKKCPADEVALFGVFESEIDSKDIEELDELSFSR